MRYIFLFFLFVISSEVSESQTSNHTFFSFTTKGGLTFVDSVIVNSKLCLEGFIIDTGSEFTILDSAYIKDMNFRKTERAYRVHDIRGYIREQHTVKIDSIKLGNIIYYNILALIIDLSQYDIAGVIGCNIMKDFVWKFDYPNQKITRFYNISETPSKSYYNIPFNLRGGIPYINIKIGSKMIRNVVFDIGNVNPISFALKDTSYLLAEAKENYYIRTYLKSLNNPNGHLQKVNGSKFQDVYFGTFNLDSVTAIFIGNKRALGSPLLHDSNVIMDFPSRKIYFNKFEQKSYKTIGCRFEINSNGEILVSSITDGSPADKAGIKLDDILIYMEGYDTQSLKDSVSNDAIYNYQGKTITLRMEGWKEEKTLGVYLK